MRDIDYSLRLLNDFFSSISESDLDEIVSVIKGSSSTDITIEEYFSQLQRNILEPDSFEIIDHVYRRLEDIEAPSIMNGIEIGNPVDIIYSSDINNSYAIAA